MTYVRWSMWTMSFFLLDFAHWFHPSDTLKMATRSKPDAASVWPMQRAWFTSRHGENEFYWRAVGLQEVGMNCLQIIENLSSYKSRFICDLLGMRAVERSYPRPLAGRLFHRLCLRGSYYRNKDASGAIGAREQSIRRARGQAWVWILLYSLHHRIRAIVQTEDSHTRHIKNCCYIVSHVTYPRINPYVDILICSYL